MRKQMQFLGLCLVLIMTTAKYQSKILPSNHKKLSTDKTEKKKEKVNNIMMRALTGVLAKNALKGVLSEKAKSKLDRKLHQNPFAILENKRRMEEHKPLKSISKE